MKWNKARQPWSRGFPERSIAFESCPHTQLITWNARTVAAKLRILKDMIWVAKVRLLEEALMTLRIGFFGLAATVLVSMAQPATAGDPNAAAAAARAQQAAINQRNAAAAAAMQAQQAAINQRNANAAAAVRAQQAAINQRNAAAATAAANAARHGQPAAQPKAIISPNSAQSQLNRAAKGPGQAAKVFDGRR
jgi:hypothetical protein